MQVALFVPDYYKVRRCLEPHHEKETEVSVVSFTASQETSHNIQQKFESLGEDILNGGAGLLGNSKVARDVMNNICQSYIEAKDDLRELRLKNSRFDLALVDGSSQAHCLTLLPAYLGLKFIVFGSYIDPYDSNSPMPFMFYPAPQSRLTGKMGFLKRIYNFCMYASQAGGGNVWGGFHQGNSLGEKIARLDQHVLIRNAMLFLENSDDVIDYPKATFPNFIQMGGLTATPSQPLPEPLATFFDNALNVGVIIVSLGPHVFSPKRNYEKIFFGAFRRLEAHILLRLNVSRSIKRLKNVQTISWFPQNDALGHPSTRIFISHCGRNSFFEALYHSVPTLCCTFNGVDVLGTTARIVEHGVGLSLDLNTATADTLFTAITALLTDRSLHYRVKSASRLLRSKQLPVVRAVDNIEHVLRFGASHLKPRTVQMNFFGYTGLDVTFFLICCLAGFMGFIMFTLKFIIQRYSIKYKIFLFNLNTEIEHSSKNHLIINKNGKQRFVVYAMLFVIILFYIFF